MTELATPDWMQTRRDAPIEHWHATVLNGGFVASVIVVESGDGIWMARSRLCDRALRPLGETRNCGPFSTHEAACDAGQAEASRLHKAMIGPREVAESNRAIAWVEPPGKYQSQTLRRFALAQIGTRAMLLTVPAERIEIEAGIA